jgi:hypothetical protein
MLKVVCSSALAACLTVLQLTVLAALLSMLQAELGYPAEALEPLQVAEAISPLPRPALPPYNGYGTLDDSKQNCVALVPKPPKKVCA